MVLLLPPLPPTDFPLNLAKKKFSALLETIDDEGGTFLARKERERGREGGIISPFLGHTRVILAKEEEEESQGGVKNDKDPLSPFLGSLYSS